MLKIVLTLMLIAHCCMCNIIVRHPCSCYKMIHFLHIRVVVLLISVLDFDVNLYLSFMCIFILFVRFCVFAIFSSISSMMVTFISCEIIFYNHTVLAVNLSSTFRISHNRQHHCLFELHNFPAAQSLLSFMSKLAL